MVKCPVCKSSDTEIKCQLDKSNSDSFEEFSKVKFSGYLTEITNSGIHPVIYCCNQCKHCWYQQIPSDEQLMVMYSKGITKPNNKYLIEKKKNNMSLLNRLLRLKSKKKKIKLLDYGSGVGSFSKLASEKGLHVTAFEPSLSRNQINNSNIEYINNLKNLISKETKFDLIIFDNVIEHLPDPSKTLQSIKKFCNQETVIYISVPNILRAHEGKKIWSVWPYKNKIVHTMAPFEHLSGFSPKSLNILLDNLNFREISFIENFIFSPHIFLKKIILNLFRLGGSTIRLIKLK